MTIVPATMRAVLLTGHGGYDKLEYRDDVPTPQPGPGEVLIKVGACGLNNTDINTRTGWYAPTVRQAVTAEGAASGYVPEDQDGGWGGALPFPMIQGADVCGVVAAVGDGADVTLIGRRVLIDPWLLGDPPGDLGAARYFGSEVNGGFADFCVAPAGNVHIIDSPLSDAELATFACAASTAENLLTRAAVVAGDVVVITGASGGVGTAVIQLCRARGAHPIGIAALAKTDLLRSTGVGAVIDRHTPQLGDAVQAASPSGRIDVVVDVVGGPMFEQLIPALRPGGRYTTAGAIGGPIVELDLRHLIYRDLQFTGATVCPPGTFAKVVSAIETGVLRPMLAETFPLARLADAQRAFVAKQHVGNIVVEISAEPR